MLSRAVLLVPTSTGDQVFGVASPACQVIPTRTELGYIGMASGYYMGGTTQDSIVSGLIYASTDTGGTNWAFGGEQQYILPGGNISVGPYSPTPDPYTASCGAQNGGSSIIQTAITVPSSIPANFVVGPTGLFFEDRYSTNSQQPNGVSFVGASTPLAPVSLSALSGLTFVGTQVSAGQGSGGGPGGSAPQLVSLTGGQDSTGKSIALTGGAFPSNDPTQPPDSSVSIDLGSQDTKNNGYFPLISATLNTGTVFAPAGTYGGYALVTNAGGKYTIFVVSQASPGLATGWILFQQ
jgi:hypothetical protein